MRIGEVLRYPNFPQADSPVVDGLTNFFHATALGGSSLVILERGINPIRAGRGGRRLVRPAAILIRSSPHRVGSAATPWEDFFDPDNGHVRYFGDNKYGKLMSPERTPGNKLLLEERVRHQAVEREVRAEATPLLFFLAVPHGRGYDTHTLMNIEVTIGSVTSG
jgi:hypothetical protein